LEPKSLSLLICYSSVVELLSLWDEQWSELWTVRRSQTDSARNQTGIPGMWHRTWFLLPCFQIRIVWVCISWPWPGVSVLGWRRISEGMVGVLMRRERFQLLLWSKILENLKSFSWRSRWAWFSQPLNHLGWKTHSIQGPCVCDHHEMSCSFQ